MLKQTKTVAPKTNNPAQHARDQPLDHKVGLTPYIIEKSKNNPAIARQYLPSTEELKIQPHELDDPIGDKRNGKGNALVHRYKDRVLLLVSDHCAVYCRFCMRKHRVGKGYAALSSQDLTEAAEYIKTRPDIWEVILSGGDPLILAPRRMTQVIETISLIPHIQIIRLHTRLPLADPQRINQEMIESLKSKKQIYMVLHINHASEITPEVITALKLLRANGITLLSQSVLLHGVNDTVDDLEALMRSIVANGIKPYYLHHPDLVPGTSHFQLTLDKGQELMQQLRGRISGLCWPTYVLDIPGGYGKIPINPTYVQPINHQEWRVQDPQGQWHIYPPPPKTAGSENGSAQ